MVGTLLAAAQAQVVGQIERAQRSYLSQAGERYPLEHVVRQTQVGQPDGARWQCEYGGDAVAAQVEPLEPLEVLERFEVERGQVVVREREDLQRILDAGKILAGYVHDLVAAQIEHLELFKITQRLDGYSLQPVVW